MINFLRSSSGNTSEVVKQEIGKMDDRSVEDTPASQRLTNDDFRKLLMTPRATPSGGSHPAGSVREAMANSGYINILSCNLIQTQNEEASTNPSRCILKPSHHLKIP